MTAFVAFCTFSVQFLIFAFFILCIHSPCVFTPLSRRDFSVISVAPKIDYDAKYKQPVALNAGATLTLPVTMSGVPTPKVTWYFGDKELKAGNGMTIETKDNSSKLTIKNTSAANAGAYRVKAENAAGSDEASFNVTMKG